MSEARSRSSHRVYACFVSACLSIRPHAFICFYFTERSSRFPYACFMYQMLSCISRLPMCPKLCKLVLTVDTHLAHIRSHIWQIGQPNTTLPHTWSHIWQTGHLFQAPARLCCCSDVLSSRGVQDAHMRVNLWHIIGVGSGTLLESDLAHHWSRIWHTSWSRCSRRPYAC